MGDTLLQVTDLKSWIGDGDAPVRAVDGVDLQIRRGETFALLGESGCGKSMSALSIMRLLPPAGRIVAGHVRLADNDLLELSESAMRELRGGRIGMIFQEPMTSLNAVMTVGEQIAESVRLHDLDAGNRVAARVVELLDSVGIPDPVRRADEYPHQLSGGMKQRVMIAMALAGRPDLLIADEPTTALDVTIQAQVLTLLKQLQRDSGMAVLLITHDLGVVAEVADRLAVMYAGQIIEQADVATFFERPLHPYSRKLFESLPGQQRRDAELAVIEGTVPPLDRPFTGCRFHDRCDRVQPQCEQQLPPWQGDLQSGIRCHLPDGEVDSGQPPVFVERPDKGRKLASISSLPSVQPQPGSDLAPLLQVRDLKMHFPIHRGVLRRVVGQVRAVDGVDLSIAPGRTLALVGESGCGKTTVGKAVLQLLRPTAGSVLFEERELTRLQRAELRPLRSRMQIIFQDPVASMNPRMLVGDIVAEGMQAQRIGATSAERRARVAQLLEQVGLTAEAANRYPNEFSGGQRQRICVARALAVEPGFIVCDEPTSALDVSVQAQILNLLRQLQQQHRLAYLFITHDISVVAYLAHEVAVMYLGRIVERGTVEEVLESPRHPYTRALMSAVPQVDASLRRQVIRLDGDMPSPAHPPSGCHFHPRCSEADERCRRAYPDRVQLSDSHSINCFRASSG